MEWGNGEISLRATWDRGGHDPITARRVPSKLRETEGGKRDEEKGNRKQGDCSTKYTARPIVVYIVNACNCLNDCQFIYACI